jgi:hypothetical protein
VPAQAPALLPPLQREGFQQTEQPRLLRSAVEDRFHDVRRQKDEAQERPEVASLDPLPEAISLTDPYHPSSRNR